MEIVSVKIGSPSQATKVNIEAPEQVKVTFKDVVINNGGGSVKSVNGQTGDVLLDAAAVGALPNTTKIPANTSDLINNSGFITKTVSDLTNYYLKSETYSREEINNKISAIPKFKIKVVTSLPTTGISDTTVYLVKSGADSSNLYTEYIYVNGKWEILGAQALDLSKYALKTELPTKTSQLTNDSGYLTSVPSEYVTHTELGQTEQSIINQINRNIENEFRYNYLKSEGTYGDPATLSLKVSVDGNEYKIPYLDGTQIKPYNLPLATDEVRGAMSAEQYTKLEGIEEGAEKNFVTDIVLSTPGYADVHYWDEVGGPGGSTGEFTDRTLQVATVNNGYIRPQIIPTVTDSLKGAMTPEQKQKLEQLSEEIADLTLGLHTDGLVYLFKNGEPQGTGIVMTGGETGDVVGNVDSSNTIMLNGDIPDGTYTVKYEMEDGRTINIGNFVLDSNVYYSITKNLTNCTINNGAVQAVKGGSYSATITANDGYDIESIVVTMGGSPVTVSGGKINIANVTGNIVITAVAEKKAPSIVNQIPISQNADGTLYVGANGEKGYNTNKRLSGSSGNESTQDNHEVTGFIPVKYGDKVYIREITTTSGTTTEVMVLYDANHTKVYNGYTGNAFGSTTGAVKSCTIDSSIAGQITASMGIAYMRISAGEINANSVITVNQEITADTVVA